MSTSIKKMTSDQIRTRLAEIQTEQATHDARDFDAELLTLMQRGGDVDVLENQQLDAERVARRLRVEAQALKAMLPDVIRAEVRAAVENLVKEGQPDQQAMQERIKELVALDQKRLEIYAAIDTITERQRAAMNKAHAITGLGRVGAHGETRGEERIVSASLAQELLGLMPAAAISYQDLPAQTAGPLFEYLRVKSVEREHAQRVADMREIAQQQAATI